MDLDTRLRHEGGNPSKEQANGATFKAVVQQASPIQTTHQTEHTRAPVHQDSLPLQQDDLLQPQVPVTGSDSSSRVQSNSRSMASEDGFPRRRSVQFARDPVDSELDEEHESSTGLAHLLSERRGVNLLSKLKALASSSNSIRHVRNSSPYTSGQDYMNGNHELFSPDSEFRSPAFTTPPISPSYLTPFGSDSDSDASDDANTVQSDTPRIRRRSRRPGQGGTQTAPVTPKIDHDHERPHLFHWGSSASGGVGRRSFLRRRATMDDMRQDTSGGVTNQEVEDSHRARAAELLRGISYNRMRVHQRSRSENPRPGHFRRAFTSVRDRADGEPSPWRAKGDVIRARGDKTAERTAAQWRKIKAGMRAIGRAKKAKITIDHAKSAELLAELSAGTPAVMMLASMFLRDEHGNRRVPILLEQVKVKVVDARGEIESEDKYPLFRVELEYGNGTSRMKWDIERSYDEFRTLFRILKARQKLQKLKVYEKNDARYKFPKFPKHAFTGELRSILHELGASDSEGDDDAAEDGGDDPLPTSSLQRPVARAARSFRDVRRKLSVPATPGINGQDTFELSAESRREKQMAKACIGLQNWLQQILRYVMFRPESNRLCRFLEISALGIRLAAEDSYHGKEGYGRLPANIPRSLHISLPQRQSRYFLVRQSYIVVVDSPETMHIYDVFMVDSDFQVRLKKDPTEAKKLKRKAQIVHRVKLKNSERKMKIFHAHEKVAEQWTASLQRIEGISPWAKKQRFDSFAPVRQNVFAQWLVDGRDYMWNVSRAISMAKDVIYIHDWWLSPELYMRRPACISQKWRLDRLLREKARQGVKIFVIVYRNVEQAIPIDSNHTKFSLLDLHPNVFVQRSPNQMRQATFFWAHHEKICIIDHMLAFVGGIDLCFGRWDTPQHTVADDKPTGFEDINVARNADNCQMWPGKDYSNPRVQDFHNLGEPYEEMYDRSRVARMPWHDIAMQVVGQPARDLARHFVQRWNYILRQRTPTRPTPMLLPPPELDPKDLENLGLNGTCEVQMLRSCGQWSMGTPERIEHSIMTAYCAAIQQSDHFVYIENQFFITTCEFGDVVIRNSIGDALVERIIQADDNAEKWRAVIVIPLVPGFESTVDAGDGTSIRLIMQCQFRSICRGETSIFGRLRAAGIDPEQYIKFFSLRAWGRIGPNQLITTEQLYIHAKCMVVDDKTAIIGSANINERSMLGDRDSECAAIVRDTDKLWSTMGGKPYLVGRFPHTLRIRLMREHLGLDVDAIVSESNLEQASTEELNRPLATLHEFQRGDSAGQPKTAEQRQAEKAVLARTEDLHSFNGAAPKEQAHNPNIIRNKAPTKDPNITDNPDHRRDVDGFGVDRMVEIEAHTLVGGQKTENRPRAASAISKQTTQSKSRVTSASDRSPGYAGLPPLPPIRTSTFELGLAQVSMLPPVPLTDDIDIGGPPLQRRISSSSKGVHPLLAHMKFPQVTETCMQDPLVNGFYDDIWDTVAKNNTAIFRAVFRCQPDDEVTKWSQYKEYAAYSERFARSQGGGRPTKRGTGTGPPGAGFVEPHRDDDSSSQFSVTRKEKFKVLGKKVQIKLKAGKAVDLVKPDTLQEGPHVQGDVDEWASNAAAENEKRGLQNSARKDSVLTETKAAANTDDNHGDELTNEKVLPPQHEITKEDLNEKNSLAQQPSKESVRTAQIDGSTSSRPHQPNSHARRARAGTTATRREFQASDDVLSAEEALELLSHIQGHLIIWPTDWLVKEEQAGRWQFGADGIAPMEIYD